MGIVGLPNVGKSSLFNALCKLNVPAENFPFCTLEPNTARVPVPDKRYDQLVKVWNPKKRFSAVLTVTDIAGLVKGAHEGKGLGNEFLANISATDALFHVTRAFSDGDVTHVEGNVDPVRDLQIINDELRFKDLQIINNLIESKRKNVDRGVGGKEAKIQFDIWCLAQAHLKSGKHIRFGKNWNTKEVTELNKLQFLTAKPQLVLVNLSAKGFKTQRSNQLPLIAKYLKENGNSPMIPFSVAFEQQAISTGSAGTQMPRIIKSGYKALRLQNFFTTGHDEVKAWTFRKGLLAPQCAGIIHTDFEKGFICAEIYKFKDLKKNKLDEKAVKAAGLCRTQGRTYVMQDGDIVFFKFNAPKTKKKK